MLGLSDHLVGISHECDYPPTVRQVPIMVKPVVDHEVMGSADIDRRVKALVSSGKRLYSLHEQAFLDARPDVILAQDLCHVCACLLYTSDAADERSSVDLGGRRI